MCENIFISDSVLKQFPSGVVHPLTPILYAENGTMPASGNRTKKCVVVVTMAGVFLLRPQMFSSYKVSIFTSIFTITEVERFNESKRVFRTSSLSCFFTSDHADVAIAEILTAKALLFKDTTDPQPILIKGYTKTPEMTQSFSQPISNISVLRYYCLCTRFQCAVTDAMLDFFKKVDSISTSSVTLGPSCVPPDNVKAFYIPFGLLKNINEICLDNVCPKCVCRLVHFLLKRTANTKSVKFENYNDDIIPEQLRFETVPEGTVAFSFSSCCFSLGKWEAIFKQFSLLKTSVQKFSISNCSLTSKQFECFISAFDTCRCFRTIELLEIDGIKFEGTWKTEVPSYVFKVFKRCRFLTIFSISNWATPSVFNVSDFSNAIMLSEVSLRGQDMSQQTLNFTIPPNVRTLDLSNCHFSYQSLRSFLTSLSTSSRRLTLSLADIVMPEGHWETLFETLNDIPRSKCIYELDWSGNPIPAQFARALGEFLLRPNPIAFISLDRIFTASTLDNLSDLLNSCEKRRIWGLSIRGSPAKCFGSVLAKFIEIISELSDLSVLDVSFQLIPTASMKKIIEYVKKRHIRQFSVDGTLLDTSDHLYDFYITLLNSKSLKAVGRPLSDLARLTSSIEDSHFKKFANQIKPLQLPATRRVREMYFGSKDATKKFNGESLDEYQMIYPLSLIEQNPVDNYCIFPEASVKARPSLFASHARENRLPIEDIQNRSLKSVKEPPQLLPEGDMEIPSVLSALKEHPGFLKRSSQEFDISKHMNFERLIDTPELRNVLDQLAETIDIEDAPDTFDDQLNRQKSEIAQLKPPERGSSKAKKEENLKAKEKKKAEIKQKQQDEKQKQMQMQQEQEQKEKEKEKQKQQATPQVETKQAPISITVPIPTIENKNPIKPLLIKSSENVKQEIITEAPQVAPPKPIAVVIPKIEASKPTSSTTQIPKKRKVLKEWSNNRMIIPSPMRFTPFNIEQPSDVPPFVQPDIPTLLPLPSITSPQSVSSITHQRKHPNIVFINSIDYVAPKQPDEALFASHLPTITPIKVEKAILRPIEVFLIDEPNPDPLITLPIIEIVPLPIIDEISVKKIAAKPLKAPSIIFVQPTDRSDYEIARPSTMTTFDIRPIQSPMSHSIFTQSPISIFIPEVTTPTPIMVPHLDISSIPSFAFDEPIELKRMRMLPPSITICGPPTQW